MAPRRAPKIPRLTIERPCDHPPDPHRVCMAPRDLTNIVEPLDRNDLLMGRDLQDGVGGRIEDRLPGTHVLRTKLCQNGGPAPSVVADKFHGSLALNRADQFIREPLEHRERLIKNRAREFPMSRRRVLAGRALPHSTVAGAILVASASSREFQIQSAGRRYHLRQPAALERSEAAAPARARRCAPVYSHRHHHKPPRPAQGRCQRYREPEAARAPRATDRSDARPFSSRPCRESNTGSPLSRRANPPPSGRAAGNVLH